MASKAVVDAVEGHIGATWNGLPVIGANTGGEADGQQFILVQYPVSNTDRPVVDRRFYREEGGFRIVLHAHRGNGASQALTWCDQLAELFRDRDLGNGVKTQVPGSPFIDDQNDQGNFFQCSLVVPYSYQFST